MSNIRDIQLSKINDNLQSSPIRDNDNAENLSINDTSFNSSQPVEKIKKKKIKWSDKHVDILVDWADKAMCYRWLHSRNTDRYRMLNTWFTIPVIVMSTLTGTANFAQEQVPQELRNYYSMIVGSVNILAGIITTIQNFLKISQLNESHRVASIAWDKFYRKIKLEIAKSPEERIDVEIFLKNSSEEFDRLIETSPDIDRTILIKFKETFEGKKNLSQKIKDTINRKLLIDEQGEIIAMSEKQKAFKDINKPMVYDYLESVRGSVYKAPPPPPESIIIMRPQTPIIEPPKPLEKIISEPTSNVLSEIVRRKRNAEEKERKINEFCSQFKEKYSREPTEDELVENLENEQEKITKAVITNFVSKFREKRSKILDIHKSNVNNENDNVVIDIKE